MIYQIDLNYPLFLRKNNDDGSISGIPVDEENTDYQAYLEWLAEGNEPEIIDLSQ